MALMILNKISLGDFCKAERKKQCLSQTELGEKCGLSLYKINSLENGSGATLLKEGLDILEALGYETQIDGEKATIEILGEAVKRKRIYLDLTQQEAADKAGISKQTIRKIERGLPTRFENAVYVFTAMGLFPKVIQIKEPVKKSGELNKLCRNIRNEEGLTQKELAEKSYVCWQTIQQFEVGDVSPRIDTAEAIFKGLGYRIVIEAIE